MRFSILDDGQTVLTSNRNDLEKYMRKGYDARIERFGKTLFCYGPTSYPYKIKDHRQKSPHNFISLSVTATRCALNCDHCRGSLLKGMQPATTPDELLERCREVKIRGGEGVLISGGSDKEGRVPLVSFGDAIRSIKEDIGLKVVVHTGLVDSKTVSILSDAGVDAAMLDVIGKADIAERVYHLEDGLKGIERSLSMLSESQLPVVPHVLVGLDYGRPSGELDALELVSRYSPSAVVVIVLSPVKKTPMEGLTPPAPEYVGKVLTVARLGMPQVPLLLGCARPIGEHKIATDIFAVKSGVNGVAYISQEGVSFAKERGLHPAFRDVCCSLAPQMIE